MTDHGSQKSDAQEPSMEDILASIRRILAEDGAGAAAEPEPAAAAPARTLSFADDVDEDAAPVQRRPRPAEQDAPELRAASSPAFATPQVEEDGADVPSSPAAAASPGEARAPSEQLVPDPQPVDDDGDVFVLSPEMRTAGHKLVSPETAADSTDVLSKLARAILERRDIAIGSRDLTLEGLVREMLRPLLREWLDRNLPYLIERLVRKEIDLMINRAERLED